MDTVKSIEAAINGSGPISRNQVKAWMRERDIEVQGAVAYLITYPPQCDRIDPPLEESDYEAFLPRYYDACLRLDLEGEWADSRHGVAWQLVEWFQAVPPEDDIDDQPFLAFLRDWLAEEYKNGKPEVRTVLIQAVLAPVLEDARWRPFFEGWKDDAELKEAIDNARELGTDV
jgi:hypothetical protein